jgi:hypothetical protein
MATFDFRILKKLWNHSYSWNSVCGFSTNFGINDTMFGLPLGFFWVNFFESRQGGMWYGGLRFQELKKIVELLLELE